MTQSSTSPWRATMLGTSEAGSKGLGVCPSTVKKKVVGLFGSCGSSGVSVKYSFRTTAGDTSLSQVVDDGGSGIGDFASAERGSGASRLAMMLAIGRVGSFSPTAPVLTLRVTKLAREPSGGPFITHSIRPPGGTPRCVSKIKWFPDAPWACIGTPSSATTSTDRTCPSNNNCRLKYVIAEAFSTRQSCRSPGFTVIVAGGYFG